MDKVIRESKEPLRIGQVASERTSYLTSIFSQPVGREGEEKGKPDLKRESFRERDSTFSLNFPAIGPAVSSRARGRVHPHGKGFA